MSAQPLLSLRIAAATFGASMAVGGLAPAVTAAPIPTAVPPVHLVVAKKPVAPRAQATTTLRTTANLNLRQHAGAHYDSLAVLTKGTAVTRTGHAKGVWWEVKAGSRTGWVSSVYLAKTADKSPAPQTVAGYRTSANLNLRENPGTHSKSLVVLAKGTAVSRTGKSSGVWWEVKAGSRTGWVSSNYVTKSNGTAPTPTAPAPTAVATHRTSANLNLRQAPGTHSKSLVVLAKDTAVARTGKSSGVWWEVKAGSRTGWVSSNYLTKPSGTAPTAPAPTAVATHRTSANLNLRENPGTHYRSLVVLPKGTAVARTGKSSGAWWEVKAGSRTGWVSSDYLTKVSGQAPESNAVAGANRWVDGTQPIYAEASLSSNRLAVQTGGTRVRLIKSSGNWSYIETPSGHGWIPSSSLATSEPSSNSTSYRWTAYAANVRTGPSTSFSTLGIIPANQKMAFVQTAEGWSQVKSSKGTGWIKNTLLTSVEYREPKELQPMTRSMISDVRDRFGDDISSVGGSRAGSVGHSSGLAADFMIKDYSSDAGIKAGDRIAQYLVENHERMGISYLIWRDKLWLAEDGQWGPYSTSGWGKHLASSRGWNDTTRHMDHIHAEISSSRANK
ncbi:SH3 domain-containing protein [Paeniglutamicibacter sp. ABSL32-1]|uniref:SH3 domain-containing protein n=1 Tax=Paeniglutamicibacter quisquiliarum TaxID=2849498 RepID=UPI001C2DA81D|nr:SH3 domain-containing protein [Paeniglutamicibacter quisquiliarum]MBV1779239.1 SH3 domain-containing protein [Paeniglutamicibacter quisquiliarum]